MYFGLQKPIYEIIFRVYTHKNKHSYTFQEPQCKTTSIFSPCGSDSFRDDSWYTPASMQCGQGCGFPTSLLCSFFFLKFILYGPGTNFRGYFTRTLGFLFGIFFSFCLFSSTNWATRSLTCWISRTQYVFIKDRLGNNPLKINASISLCNLSKCMAQ